MPLARPSKPHRPLLAAGIAAWLAACDGGSTRSDASLQAPPPDAQLRWPDTFPMLVGTATAPPVYRAARRRWRTATVAFSLGDLETSARAFMDLAERLRREELNHPEHRGAFRATRCFAYENVGAVYRGLGASEDGAALLRKARVEDPPCEHSITKTLSRIESEKPPRRDASPDVR